MLKLIDVTVRRGPNTVVTGLRLDIVPGTIFWVVGPNGAGKTSLLRVMAGIDTPASGRVRWTCPANAPGLYFQSEMALPGSATVEDWERLTLRLLPEGCNRKRTPIWPGTGRRRRFARLSTGERKRLLLDALLRRPGSLLLDEPFEHLSPDAKKELARALTARARSNLVVVATNQATHRADREGGLRLDAGIAEPIPTMRHTATST